MRNRILKISTLKCKATRNFNKSATNNKEPSAGDIMIPMYNTKQGLEAYQDDKGSIVKCIITNAYKNYLFGTVINTIPTTKTPKEVCLSDAIEADMWEYDFETCTRAVIEEKSAFSLALEGIQYQHKKAKEWQLHLESKRKIWPESLSKYEEMVKDGYCYTYNEFKNVHELFQNLQPIRSFVPELTSYKNGTNNLEDAINMNNYKRRHSHIINKACLLKKEDIIVFQDWLIQNP